MSEIIVVSNSKPTEVVAQMSDLASQGKEVEAKKSAPSVKPQGEKTEESETSENEETEVLDTKEGDDESDEESEDTKDGDQKPNKNRPGFKRRIQKLSKQLSAKEQEAEYWKQEALKRQSSPEKETKAQTPNKEADSDKPKADNFDSHEEFVEALTDWKLEQKIKAQKETERVERAKTEQQSQIQKHLDRVKSFADVHDDFHDLIEELDDVPMSMAVQEVILNSDNGPELMYELAKNRKEYERICSLPAIQAARELGKFESKIAKSSESTNEKPTTKAPPPISPLKAKSSSSVKKTIFDPNLSQAEYERLRREQMRSMNA